jgi:hypothetical protein
MPTLHDFLASGTLGPLRFGMTADEVVTALGQPDDESVSRKPRIWKYGSLQLALSRSDGTPARLTSVSMYFHSGVQLPVAVRFVEALPRRRDEVVALLATLGIAPASDTTDPTDQIRLPSGVSFAFDDGVLDSIHCSWPQSAEPARRQLTVSLPVEVFAELQARAKRDRRSVADTAAALLAAGTQAPTPPA